MFAQTPTNGKSELMLRTSRQGKRGMASKSKVADSNR
jgi:hypothetical protein